VVLLYVLVNVARAAAVLLCYPILSRGAYGINWRQAVLLSYAGLRGAVGT
jgi:NhaP-type Na+/H+ or K+/H+ antiporter